MPTFEFEIYWGTKTGTLLHDTLEIETSDFAEAESTVYRDQPIPKPGFAACAREEYFEDHYDAEFLGEISSPEEESIREAS